MPEATSWRTDAFASFTRVDGGDDGTRRCEKCVQRHPDKGRLVLTLIDHPDCAEHDTGPLHPECRARLDAINDQIIASGLDYVAQRLDAPRVTRTQLMRVHSADYLERIAAAVPDAGLGHIDGDTVLSPRSLVAAERAAGAGVLGVEMLVAGTAAPVFCMVRPPGHHAERSTAMGFCLFSNVAIAVRHALEALGVKRVAVVDFDAHHGNGTEDALCDDPRVLYCSSFQHPFFPHSGAESPCSNLLALPLPVGTASSAFREACAETWFAPLERFAPELVVFSAGFDSHALDEMSGLALTEQDFAWITREVRRLTRESTSDRYLSMLEGGYEPAALARSVIAHLRALID